MVKKVISGLLKIIVVYKEVEAYEEQGILEDGDSDHRDGADWKTVIQIIVTVLTALGTTLGVSACAL